MESNEAKMYFNIKDWVFNGIDFVTNTDFFKLRYRFCFKETIICRGIKNNNLYTVEKLLYLCSFVNDIIVLRKSYYTGCP